MLGKTSSQEVTGPSEAVGENLNWEKCTGQDTSVPRENFPATLGPRTWDKLGKLWQLLLLTCT